MSRVQEQSNPCLKVGFLLNNLKFDSEHFLFHSQEHNLSLNCLNKNNFDREKCEVFFVNYNNCKEFWVNRFLFNKNLYF